MKIYFIADSILAWQHGIYFHRIHQPAVGLEQRGHGVRVLSIGSATPDDILEWPDVVIFGRTYHPDANPIGLMRQFKAKGKRIIWDIDDDFWVVNPDNPSVFISNAHKDQYETFVRECDAVITPSLVLAKKIKKLVKNKEIHICPNMVNPEVFVERPHVHKELIIGYAGAASHWRDLNLISDVIINLQKKYDFAFQLYGLIGGPLESEMYVYNEMLKRNLYPEKNDYFRVGLDWWEKMKALKVYPHIQPHIPFYTPLLHSYRLSMCDWDIGLAPLEDNEFNRSKSCVKFYEYASVGTCTLASNVEPYKSEVNYLTKNTYKDWYVKLEKLIVDKDFRKKLIDKQRKWVLDNRTTNKVALIWELALQQPGGLKVLNQQ